MYWIFLEILGKIQFNGDDPSPHDHHQEDQDNQECPLSTGRFLIIFPLNSYIFGKCWKNSVKWK